MKIFNVTIATLSALSDEYMEFTKQALKAKNPDLADKRLRDAEILHNAAKIVNRELKYPKAAASKAKKLNGFVIENPV